MNRQSPKCPLEQDAEQEAEQDAEQEAEQDAVFKGRRGRFTKSIAYIIY